MKHPGQFHDMGADLVIQDGVPECLEISHGGHIQVLVLVPDSLQNSGNGSIKVFQIADAEDALK